MRDRAELDFIRDRVLIEIRENPPTGPLLTEVDAVPRLCRRGHDAWDRFGNCVECHRVLRIARGAKP